MSHPIDRLPPPVQLERITQSLATLDLILCDDWEQRYYSFNRRWDEKRGDRMASLRNGEGDEWFLVFGADGAFLKGFAHESFIAEKPAFGQRMLRQLPKPLLAAYGTEAAFSMADLTFLGWCTDGEMWERAKVPLPPKVEDPDGCVELLGLLDGDPAKYVEYATGYFEVKVSVAAVRPVFAHQPLDNTLVKKIAPGRRIDELREELDEIGYPIK